MKGSFALRMFHYDLNNCLNGMSSSAPMSGIETHKAEKQNFDEIISRDRVPPLPKELCALIFHQIMLDTH